MIYLDPLSNLASVKIILFEILNIHELKLEREYIISNTDCINQKAQNRCRIHNIHMLWTSHQVHG
jgi:hypothetical protein